MARTKPQARKCVRRPGLGKGTMWAQAMAAKNGSASESTSVPAPGVKKRGRRWRPGTAALRDIRRYQKSTKSLIPAAAYGRLVREITQGYRCDIRYMRLALEALREAGEAYTVEMLADANTIAIHAGRTTVMAKDLRLAVYLADRVRRPHKGQSKPTVVAIASTHAGA